MFPIFLCRMPCRRLTDRQALRHHAASQLSTHRSWKRRVSNPIRCPILTSRQSSRIQPAEMEAGCRLKAIRALPVEPRQLPRMMTTHDSLNPMNRSQRLLWEMVDQGQTPVVKHHQHSIWILSPDLTIAASHRDQRRVQPRIQHPRTPQMPIILNQVTRIQAPFLT